MATVQTVLGPVAAGQLGRVLMHEHLLCLLPGPWQCGGPRGPEAFGEEQVALAVSALSGLATHGVGTVVDVSPYGDAGRDAADGQWGYSYLSAVFLPLLAGQGVTEGQIDQMMRVSPARILGLAG
jgi:predicted metal-dependent phosphotriesterase family hydrolase